MPEIPSINLLGVRIRTARKARKITQAQLARLAKIPASTLSDYELGNLEPRYSQLLALANILGVDLNYFGGFSSGALEEAIAGGALSLQTWENYQALKYEFKQKVRNEINFLFDVQQFNK